MSKMFKITHGTITETADTYADAQRIYKALARKHDDEFTRLYAKWDGKFVLMNVTSRSIASALKPEIK